MRKRVGGAHKEVDELLEATESRSRTKDETLFNVYFASLDTLYVKLDEVFEEAGINSTPESTRILGEEPTRKMDGETHYLENVGVTRVPFNYQRTCDAVWELLSAQHRQDERYDYHGLPDAENAKALQYCSSLRQENGGVLRSKTYQVSRRFVENSRVVVVWRAQSEAEEEFPGLNMDETGWCVIHAPSSDSNCSADSTSTLVQACIRLTPMSHYQYGGNEQRGKLDQFMELSVKTVAEDNLEIEYMMERLLLDDALSTDGLVIDEEGNLALADAAATSAAVEADEASGVDAVAHEDEEEAEDGDEAAGAEVEAASSTFSSNSNSVTTTRGYPPQYPPSQELYQPQYQQYQQPPAQFQQQGYGDDGRGYNNGNPPPPPAPFQPMDNFQQYQQPPQQFQQQQPPLPQQQFQQFQDESPRYSNNPPMPAPPQPQTDYADAARYEAHVGTHVTCSDCDFSASKRVVTAHFQTAHGQYAGQGLKEIDVEGQKFMVLVGNSVEDITKWREERRKKWLAMSRQPKPTTTAVAAPVAGKRKLSVSSEEDLEEGEIEEDEEAKAQVALRNSATVSQPDAGVQEPPVKKQRKTMLCKWFSRGNCRFDDAHCKYSHDRSAFGCRAMMYKGSCSKGLYCPFSHDTAVLSGQRERSQKASKERATEQQWRGEQKSLLRKLLAKDVRVEQRKMLQIVHFLVANDLLRSSESEKADVSGQEPAVKIEVLKSEQAEASEPITSVMEEASGAVAGDNVVPVVEEASACGLESQGVSTSSDTKKENEAVESSHDGDEVKVEAREEEDTGKDTSASAQTESVNPEEVAAAVAVKDVGLFESASDSGQVPVRQADTVEASANEAC
ncbi:hypothetical protein JG688_00012220 [Phytophthora aleatoria]|uniref:C3H1-type domain-containing protein n=1 Tax=Phytophthora aleatoria TaxID=2496075 RepID=A0A8J5MEF8_9STRA|nr:hypothetical protein JG688_00012220 [Phytophthora aleatoria]